MMERNAALAAALALGLSTAAGAQWATPPKPKPAQPWAAPRPAAVPPKVGTLALARYKGGAHYWPALVTEVRGNLVTVQYSGGGNESLPASLTAPLRWTRGTAIECKLGTKTYWPATITAIDVQSYALEVVGNDGKPRKTSLRFCRSLAG